MQPVIKKEEKAVDVQKDSEETKASSPEVYILQYPLRPEARPYGDHGQLVHVRHRSYQNTLSLEYALNDQKGQCESFDKNETSTTFDSHPKQQFLTSIPCEFPNLSYGIGLLRGENLYVTPVSHILQMRPDFSYLDSSHESDRLKHSLEPPTSTEILEPSLPALRQKKDSTFASNGPTLQPNSVTGLANETPTKKEVLQKSKDTVAGDSMLHTKIETIIPPKSEWHRYPAARIRELLLKEPWELIETFYSADSCEAYELIELFTSFQVKEILNIQKEDSNQPKDFALSFLEDIPSSFIAVPKQRYIRVSGGPRVPSLRFSPNFKEYLENLCNVRGAQPGVIKADILSSGPLSYLQLFRLPPDKQILKILQHVHVESTLKIQSLLTHPLPEETFISHLNTYAHLILGNWVCKSSLIYEGLVACCRDFLIFLFLNGRTIVRETVKPYMGGLSSITLTTLLKELSEYRDNAWHFKLPIDETIIKKYSHIADAAQTTFSKEAMKALVTKIQSLSSSAQNTPKDSTLNQNSNNMSESVNGLLTKAIEHVLTFHGIQCTAMIVTLVHKNLSQEIEKLDPALKFNHTAALSLCQESEIQNILPRIADTIGNNFWALRKHPNAQLNRHRDLLLCFIKRLVLQSDSGTFKKGVTRTQILTEFESQGAPWQFPDFVLRNMLQEFFFNKGGFWVFKGFVESATK